MTSTATSALVLLLLSQAGFPMILKPGVSMDAATRALEQEKHEGAPKYKETGLQMVCFKKGSAVRYWTVDEGTLIIQYTEETKLIENIEFYLSGPGPRDGRVSFRLDVLSFDTGSGLMQVRTRSPKEAFQPTEEEIKANREEFKRRLDEITEEAKAKDALLPERR